MNAAAWQERLAAAGLMPPGDAPAPLSDPGSPWYVRLLAGVGGFIGGLMLLLFFGAGLASLKLFESPEGATFIGLVLCAGAVYAYHVARGSAAGEQAGLAVSISGQIALGIGLGQLFKSGGDPVWWPVVVVQFLLLALIGNGLHRTLTAASALILGSLSCQNPAMLTLWWGVLALTVTLGVVREGHLVARDYAGLVAPVTFGVLAGIILCQLPWVLYLWPRRLSAGGIGYMQPWLAAVPAVLLAAWTCAASASARARSAVLLLAGAVAALGFWLPGWNIAVLLALLGLASARPGWAVIAALAMIWSVSRYYYVMQVTLIEKAAWMAAAGLICLVLAGLVRVVAPRLMEDMS